MYAQEFLPNQERREKRMKTKTITTVVALLLVTSLVLCPSCVNAAVAKEPSERFAGYNTERGEWTTSNQGKAYACARGALDWAQKALAIDDVEIQQLMEDAKAPDFLAAEESSQECQPMFGSAMKDADISAKMEAVDMRVRKPTVDFTDFKNGTTLTIIDYQNGVKDVISETTEMKTAKLQLGQNTVNQLMSGTTLVSRKESAGYITATQDVVLEQEVLMGFTYVLIAERWTIIDIEVLVAYARAGIEVDIGFGLRLPVNITLEYPEDMLLGHDYELYATLTPLDRPYYDEFLCKFKANVWVEAGVWIPFVGWIEYSYSFGPNYDGSRSFATPLGPGMEFPIPPLEITVWDLWLMAIKAVIDPEVGSDKITAKASAGGDAVGEYTITWSEPDQRIPFTVHVDAYGSTGFAEIELSDFRYYFTMFKLHFKLKFDFSDWIDWLTGDPTIPLFTLDMSWLTEGLYLGVHEGTNGIVNVLVPVWEYIYEDTHGRGTILKINTRTPQKRFQFTTPDKDYGIRNITDMRQRGCHSIVIRHFDSELRLMSVTTNKLDFCMTTAWDLQTSKHYVLVDNPGIEMS